MAPVIGLYYFLILTYSYLLNNGMITASRVDPTFRLGGAIRESVNRDQNAEISGFGRLQMGRSSLVPPSAGNATNTIEAANGSLVYGHGYQSDQVLYEGAQERLQQERLQQLGLSVQCRHDGMSLKLKGNRVSHLLVDRDGAPPVPLSQLPSHCGFSVRRARRDVTLVAPYNGCHVTRQRGYYTLPLHVWGIPVMMSCPVSSSSSPPTISCGSSSMVVMLEGAVAEELSVKVSGSWEPLLAVCGKCGYNVDQGPGQLRITVPFTTPCVGLMDSGPSLRLRSAGEEMTLVCPLTSTPTPATPLLYFPYYTITTPAPTTGQPSTSPYLSSEESPSCPVAAASASNEGGDEMFAASARGCCDCAAVRLPSGSSSSSAVWGPDVVYQVGPAMGPPAQLLLLQADSLSVGLCHGSLQLTSGEPLTPALVWASGQWHLSSISPISPPAPADELHVPSQYSRVLLLLSCHKMVPHQYPCHSCLPTVASLSDGHDEM
nr:uncharacterized protein LOC111835900 [Paramormyrops kingsleyae]